MTFSDKIPNPSFDNSPKTLICVKFTIFTGFYQSEVVSFRTEPDEDW